MRIWAKLWKEGHMLRDTVIENQDISLNRTKKVFAALDEICIEFDLGRPVWLDKNITEFQKHDRVRFGADSFMEDISFDYLEMQVIEEDE